MNLDLFWHMPFVIQLHASAAMAAFGLGAAQLALPKGRTLHIVMGSIWVVLMVVVAVSAYFIRGMNNGMFSPIHLLIPLTFYGLYSGLRALQRKDGKRHGRAMRGVFLGALVLAGVFTFMPGRLMGRMFFGW